MSTDITSTNNLLFLLAAAPLGLGCIIVSDDEGTATTVADTGAATSGTSTTDASGTDTTPPATSGGSSGGSTAGSEGSTGSADSTGADSTGGGSGSCADYGAVVVECGIPYAEYAEGYCDYNLAYEEMYSAECGAAYEDFIVCLSALSCADLEGVDRCPDQLAALLALGCPAVE